MSDFTGSSRIKIMHSQDQLLKAFKKVINNDSYIKFAYLFGSKATGKSGPLSDFDLAVFLDGRLNILRYRLKLIEELARMTKNEHFDLVTLNDAPPVLKYEVIRSGKLLKDDKPRRVAFETRVLREYLDTACLRRTQQQYLKEKLSRGAGRLG